MYCGSFHDGPLLREEFETLFTKDNATLMNHLSELPKLCGMRKINEMVKRIRLNIVNYCLITYLKSQMPMLWGHETKQKYLLEHLDEVYKKVAYQYNLSDADFPNMEEFRGKLQKTMFSDFPKADRATLSVLSDMLSMDIPQIFKSIAGVTSASERDKDHEGDDDGDQNLKAMMNFDLNTPVAKDNENSVSIIFALIFVLIVIAVGFAFQGGYLNEWLAVLVVMMERAKSAANDAVAASAPATTAADEPSL